MAQFATEAELAAYLSPLEITNDLKTKLVLEAASAAVQAHTRRRLERVSETVALRGTNSGVLQLPEQPVISVEGVTYGDLGTPYTVDFSLQPGGVLIVGNALSSLWGDDPDFGGSWGGPGVTVNVAYTHGFDPMPQAIRSAALMIAARIWEHPGTGAQIASESIGAYAYTLGSQVAAEGLVGPEAELLAPFCVPRMASVLT